MPYQHSADGEKEKSGTGNSVAAAICIVIAVLLILMQIVYSIYNRRSGYEYIADWMLYAVNAVIIFSAFFYVFFLFRTRKSAILISGIVLSVLFCLNLVLMGIYGFSNVSIVSLSPDMHHVTVLKQSRESGSVTVYRNVILLFARRYEQLPETVEGEPKLQWLVPDVCSVTYEDTEDTMHQYVCTYGDRGDGIYYYTVDEVIRGKWAFDSHNTDDRKITVEGAKITIKNGDTTSVYDEDDCVQFGTLALVLCRNGLPEWTIALNDDCEVFQGLRILDEGTITLCPVSMEKTAPLKYFRTYNPVAEALAQQKKEEENTPSQVYSPQPAESLPSDLSGLSKYNSIFGVMELNTDSTDMFEVARLALAQGHKQTGAVYNDTELQILQMKLLAGDINEFLIEVQASGSNLSGPLDYDWTFRIRKGDGLYGAVRVADNVDATEGLVPLAVPQIKDTSDDPEFFLYIPAPLTEIWEQDGLATAQQMADILTESPDLSDFKAIQGLVKVQTDATDIFVISRLAVEENLKTFAVNGYDQDVQITRVILLAGDENEFVVKVYTETVVSDQNTSEIQCGAQQYRVKKGDDVYLVMASVYDTVNSAGLVILDTPLVKDVSQDADYHFFVPAEQTD